MTWQVFGRHNGIYLARKFMTSQHHQESHVMLLRIYFLLNSGTLSTSCERNHITFHFEDFLNHEFELYLKQQLTPPQRKIIVAYCISNHRLAIEFGMQLTIPIPKDDTSCHFCTYNVVGIDAHLVSQCPLCNSIGDTFPSLVEHVVLGNHNFSSLPIGQSS